MKLKNVSASQVATYDACPRAWHFGWVRGFKTPPTIAMQRGTLIHAGIEHALRTGVVRADEWAPYVKSMLAHLPQGLPERTLIEHEISIDTAPGLPPWKGFIDLLDDTRYKSQWLRVTDHKTTSDFRYAKTPAELAENTQLNSYAFWVFANGHDEDTVEVGHLYIRTEKTLKESKAPKSLPVYVTVDRAQVAAIWARDMVLVEKMVRDAEVENTDLLDPKGTRNGQCQKYGGCPHRSRCGLDVQAPLYGNEKGEGKMADFLKRLEAAKAKTNGNGNGAVLPPDAPERTTPVAVVAPAPVTTAPVKPKLAWAKPLPPAPASVEAVAEAEVAAAVGLLRAGQGFGLDAPAAAPAPAPAKRGRPRKDAGTDVVGKPSFALYIDCMPTKDVDASSEPTLFEDWVQPLLLTLNEEAMKASNLPDYRLLPFSQEKAAFTAAINEALTRVSMPQAIVIQSSSPSAKDALGVLIPHARQVVRGLRG